MVRRSLGRQFGWLWTAYAVSTFGTFLAFDAFPLIAILVLHSGPTEVSLLAVRSDDLLVANARFESTTWTAIAIGPPLGGAAIGLFGPVTTVVVDAVSYLLSAIGIRAIGGHDPRPVRTDAPKPRARDLSEGWRYILTHPALRPVFFNVLSVNGLILAVEPLIAVLMLGRLGFAPWQYGLAFAAPCVGGLIGSRLARQCHGSDRRRSCSQPELESIRSLA